MLTPLALANQRQANLKDARTVSMTPAAAINARETEALAPPGFDPPQDAGSNVAPLPCQVNG